MYRVLVFLSLCSIFIPAQAMQTQLSCTQGFDLISLKVIHNEESDDDKQGSDEDKGSGDKKGSGEEAEPECD